MIGRSLFIDGNSRPNSANNIDHSDVPVVSFCVCEGVAQRESIFNRSRMAITKGAPAPGYQIYAADCLNLLVVADRLLVLDDSAAV